MTPIEIYRELCRPELSLDIRQAVRATDALIMKQGLFGLDGITKGLANATGPIALAALAGPPVAGYMIGDAMAKSFDVDKSDIAEIQEQELIDELLHNAAAIRRRRSLREGGSEVPG